LPDPDVLALEIAENLESALGQFRAIYEELEKIKKSASVFNILFQ
jgi:hypothetical protein